MLGGSFRKMPAAPGTNCPVQLSALFATMSAKQISVFLNRPRCCGTLFLERAPDALERVSQSLQLSGSGWLIIVALECACSSAANRL